MTTRNDIRSQYDGAVVTVDGRPSVVAASKTNPAFFATMTPRDGKPAYAKNGRAYRSWLVTWYQLGCGYWHIAGRA